MPSNSEESNWKTFRKLQAIALERFCQQTLDEITAIVSETGKSSHERYLKIFRLLRDRDGEIATGFNDPRRSTAWRQFVYIDILALWTEAEIAMFSPEWQEHLKNARAMRDE